MATTVPTKIVLKSTTRMSLNDRFSIIAPTIQKIRSHMVAEHQVSVANQRLAQQLANRPGIQASASNMYLQQPRGGRGGRGNFNPSMKKANLQQRLGKSNIKNRLSLPGGQPMRGRGRGGRGRGGNISVPGDYGDSQWVSTKMRGRGQFSPRGPRGRGAFRGRGRGTFNRSYENTPNEDNRRRRRRRRRRYAERFGEQNQPAPQVAVTRGNSRGMRRGGRRGRGAGRGSKSGVSVTDLDNQLDAYMSKTKLHLDSELDAYMSEVSK